MSILLLVMLTIILNMLIIATIILFSKDLFEFVSRGRKNYREFIIKNEGFFTIFFVLVFLVEQLLLIIILAYFFQLSKWLSAIVGIFALIVVTTAAFQKFIWEYKFRWAEDLGKSAEYAIPIIDEQREFIESLIGRLKK